MGKNTISLLSHSPVTLKKCITDWNSYDRVKFDGNYDAEFKYLAQTASEETATLATTFFVQARSVSYLTWVYTKQNHFMPKTAASKVYSDSFDGTQTV